MPKIFSVDEMPGEFVDDPDLGSKMSTRYLSALASSERIYVNIDRVQPGGKSARYHSHSAQEEFFLVLRGAGTVRLDGVTAQVKPGDFFAKPAGGGVAHQFINDGDEVLEILDCGLRVDTDVVTYPDEKRVRIRPSGLVFRLEDREEGWSTDPNAG